MKSLLLYAISLFVMLPQTCKRNTAAQPDNAGKKTAQQQTVALNTDVKAESPRLAFSQLSIIK
jgi:hypothetical protein